jgi:hypothetical protein
VPAADEVFLLQNGRGAESDFFRSCSNGVRLNQGDTRQGTWCVTPGGELLGAANDRNPRGIAKLMKDSLDKWKAMPKARRLRSAPVAAEPEGSDRNERFHPKGGLVLRSYSRDFPGGDNPTDWMAKAWNTDVHWFTAEEARSLLPNPLRKGSKIDVPAPIVRRIARFALVDNVRGQTWAWQDGEVEKASLSIEVGGVKDGVVSFKLAGAARCVARGNWSVRGHQDPRPTPQERGCDMKLLGRATFDTNKDRWTLFELTAVGTRWGGTQYNRRENDLAAAPWGVVLTMADATDKVAPSAFWSYGWRR